MDKKVKLVAIAKDEAAYLPEWIYHHLAVGFDEIEVLVNYTSDNSTDILDKIGAHYPVKYRVIDNSIVDYSGNFQMSAYRMMASESANQFDYIMFLDIDEFWTDSQGEHTIKDAIYKLNSPEVIAFQWGIKLEEPSVFTACYSQENHYIPSRFLKVIFSTTQLPINIYVHKVEIEKGRYLFSNGQTISAENKAELEDDLFRGDELDRYFIVHRVYRSEQEYVSLLGRGRPRNHDQNRSQFELKNNRFGYKRSAKNQVQIDYPQFQSYRQGYYKFIDQCDFRQELDQAKFFVCNRYNQTLLNLLSLSEKEERLLNQVIQGVEIPEVVELVNKVKQKWLSDKQSAKVTGQLRDLAIEFENKNDINSAFQIMSMAKTFRPNGPLINRKLELYKQSLKTNNHQ